MIRDTKTSADLLAIGMSQAANITISIPGDQTNE